MLIQEALNLVANLFIVFVRELFSLIPIYQRFSNLKDQIIAAGLGVPVMVVSITGAAIGIIKLIMRLARKFI